MAQSAPLMLRLIALSVKASARAGKIIRDVMSRGDLGTVDKGKNDLQTEADRSSQRCIVATLSRQFPTLCIIGEEDNLNYEVPSDWIINDMDQEILSKACPAEYSVLNDKDIVVWVDPMDGTSEYTQGFLEHVTVMIGIAVQGKAVGGVIHQPYYNLNEGNNVGRTIWGLVGLGAGGITPIEPNRSKLVLATTRSHWDETVQMALDALKPDEIKRVGGAGYKVLMLLEGKANAYVFASGGPSRWDTCAPEAILTALGGKLTDMNGDHYNYQKTNEPKNLMGVFATAKGVDHESLITMIPQEVRDSLRGHSSPK